MERRLRYADVRPYVVLATLEQLAGPTVGVVELPTSLDWTPHRRYDLSLEHERRLLYETVLREAMHVQELERYLNAALLLELWPLLWLPSRLRTAWQERFPQLQATAAA